MAVSLASDSASLALTLWSRFAPLLFPCADAGVVGVVVGFVGAVGAAVGLSLPPPFRPLPDPLSPCGNGFVEVQSDAQCPFFPHLKHTTSLAGVPFFIAGIRGPPFLHSVAKCPSPWHL